MDFLASPHFQTFKIYYLIAFGFGIFAFLFLRPCQPTKSVIKPTLASTPEAFKQVDIEAEMNKSCPKTGKRYAVIGVGFVGRCLVESLLERGDGDGTNGNTILCIDMMKQNPFETTPYWCHGSAKNFFKPIENAEKRIEYVQADVTDAESLIKALKGKNVEVVYCTAALIAFNQRLASQAEISYRVNVLGARNVCDAMIECGIPYLVFTSTSNVILRIDDDSKKNLTEDAPLATRETSYNHYSWSKAEAEQVVLAKHGTPLKKAKNSNSDEKKSGEALLQVVAVRPCSGVFGYYDRFMSQRLALDPNGQMFMSSSDRSHIDHIYVNNLVFGELLAEKALVAKTEGVAGQALNVVGHMCCTENIYRLMQEYWPEGAQVGRKRLPITFLPGKIFEKIVAPTVEFLQLVTGGSITPYLGELAFITPPMFSLVTMSYSINGDKAKKVIQYRDLFSLQQACQRLSWQYYVEEQEKKKTNGKKQQ